MTNYFFLSSCDGKKRYKQISALSIDISFRSGDFIESKLLYSYHTDGNSYFFQVTVVCGDTIFVNQVNRPISKPPKHRKKIIVKTRFTQGAVFLKTPKFDPRTKTRRGCTQMA
jgi:hypothetical protein